MKASPFRHWLPSWVNSLCISPTTQTSPYCVCDKYSTLALFTPTDPVLCGPYFAPHVSVLQKKPTCFPCLKKKCHDPFCMLQISTDEVLGAALKIFRRKNELSVVISIGMEKRHAGLFNLSTKCKTAPFTTIVVDNGSSDDSVLEIGKRFPQVTLLETGKKFRLCRRQ